MHWLKTWLRTWLGIEENRLSFSRELTAYANRLEEIKSLRSENAELIQRLDHDESRLETIKIRLNGLGDHIRELDNTAANLHADMIDIVKLGGADNKRITELESIVKDSTLDTALAALEDRVSKIEATPAPAPTSTGRRSGSAWASHQVAASQGAARENGLAVPLPTPGVS
jgi:DNA repair exonuclease SbcCD ATPase subunit